MSTFQSASPPSRQLRCRPACSVCLDSEIVSMQPSIHQHSHLQPTWKTALLFPAPFFSIRSAKFLQTRTTSLFFSILIQDLRRQKQHRLLSVLLVPFCIERTPNKTINHPADYDAAVRPQMWCLSDATPSTLEALWWRRSGTGGLMAQRCKSLDLSLLWVLALIQANICDGRCRSNRPLLPNPSIPLPSTAQLNSWWIVQQKGSGRVWSQALQWNSRIGTALTHNWKVQK